MKTVVLGLGNLLLQDEGVGVRAIERLQARDDIPEDVVLLDGGTLGMELLVYFEGINKLVIIDAMEMDEPPGTLLRLENDQIPAAISMKLSPHQAGLAELLSLAQLQDLLPEEIILWGIQPGQIETGLELSPEISEKLETLVQKVIQEFST